MKKRFRAALLSLGLLLLLAQPAFAAELGEPNITPQTTMRELRENPSLKASGYYTFCREMLSIEKAITGIIKHWSSMQGRSWSMIAQMR